MSPSSRRLVVRALVVAASVVLVLAMVAGYTRRAAVDSDQFANRATAALRDDSVRALVAERITDDVVLANQADLITTRPIIQSAAAGILAVADVGTVLTAALEKVDPSLARKLESDERVALLERDVGSVSGDLGRLADEVRVLAPVLLMLAVLLAAGALALSRDRRRTVVELGMCVAGAGVVLVVAYGVLRSLAVDQVEGPEARAAAGAVWDAFLGDLRTSAWILAGSGAVVAAAAASLIKPVDIREPLRRAADWLAREPRHPGLRVLRGVGLIAAGVLVLVEREAALLLLLVVINQDYVTPADYVAALKDGGLERFAYRGPVDSDWPTLRQMIDTGQRVFFLAENQAGAAPWYHLVYGSITQETPFSFTRVAQLTDPERLPATREPNRGPASAPLFLVNHWITTDPVPKPSNAAQVNAYDALLRRTRECRRIRKRVPNLVAVDFYRRGDLFRVVDTLNGVG